MTNPAPPTMAKAVSHYVKDEYNHNSVAVSCYRRKGGKLCNTHDLTLFRRF
jgi:hypothetical protein